VLLVADTLDNDSTSGQLFISRNKKADKLKALYWEDDAFWMFYIKTRVVLSQVSGQARCHHRAVFTAIAVVAFRSLFL
jgi:hypothetical protein